MKINDLLTFLIISLASTGELNSPLHICILQHTQHQEGLLSLHSLPLLHRQNLQLCTTHQCVVSMEKWKTTSPSFFFFASWVYSLTSFSNHSAIHLHPQEVLISQIPIPWGQHLGRSFCTQGLRAQRSHPKSLYTLTLALTVLILAWAAAGGQGTLQQWGNPLWKENCWDKIDSRPSADACLKLRQRA